MSYKLYYDIFNEYKLKLVSITIQNIYLVYLDKITNI